MTRLRGNSKWIACLFIVAGFVASCAAAVPDQVGRWNSAKTDPRWSVALDNAVSRYVRTAAVYERLQQARANGVPAPVIFSLHGRESSWSFLCHLHEGSPLTHRTRYVPKGRIPGIQPPYSFEVSAIDALYDYEHLDRRDWVHLGPALQAMESYNGLGYQKRGVVSPYMWSGTTIYRRGKYVSDGRFDPMAVDQQLGVAAILKRMEERGMRLPFKS